MMKKDATLINCSRGPVIDEVALTNFLQANENFRCGTALNIRTNVKPNTDVVLQQGMAINRLNPYRIFAHFIALLMGSYSLHCFRWHVTLIQVWAGCV